MIAKAGLVFFSMPLLEINIKILEPEQKYGQKSDTKIKDRENLVSGEIQVCTVQIYSVPFGLAYSRTLTLKNCALIIIIVMGGKKKIPEKLEILVFK